MKKLFSILLVLFAFIASAQDPSPLPSITVKKLIAPNNPTFYYNTVDSALWVFKGETGWLRIATNQQLIKYYVPYIGANKNVNLGIYTITARGQRLPLFNGACQISTLTDHGNGTVTIGNGDYHLASDVTGHDSKIYSLTGGTFTMTDLSQNYIVADYNSGNPLIKVITDVTLINETTIVPIYSIFRNGNFLHTQNWDALGLALANKVHQSIVKTQRYRRESGLALSESGTRNLNLTSGRVWIGAIPVSLDAIATATDNLFLWHHTGGVWTQSVLTQYNNSQYDNGTNLTALLPNRYAVNWIFRGVESQKHLYAVLGTGDYTESQAISATIPAIPVAISSHAVLVAKLIVKKDDPTVFSIQSAFDTQFGLSAIQAHGDLTGRDVVDSHPAEAISFTPASTISSTDAHSAILESLSDAKDYADTKDPSVSNELNTNFYYNSGTKELGITDSGGTRSVTITIPGSNIVNAFTNTLPITASTTTVTFPTAMTYENYRPILRVWYNKNINGKNEEIINSVYDFNKTVNGFSFKVDTVAGYFFYLAVDTTNIYPITVDNFVPWTSVVTSVGSPGNDLNIPTEKAVRTAIQGFTETDPVVKAINGLVKSNGSTISVASNTSDYLSPSLAVDITLNSKSILYNSTLGSNNTWSGETITGTAGETLAFGDFVYYKFSDGKYWKAKADAYATARCIGISTGSISANASGTFLIRGIMRYDTWNWTAAEVWLSAGTGGAGTSTQPSTTGNQIQYIARALTADVLFFNPSTDIGEK